LQNNVAGSIGLRRAIDLCQIELAKAANLSSPTSLEWRLALPDSDDASRLARTHQLLSYSPDGKIQELISSPQAMRLVTERHSIARNVGNQAAHSLPSRDTLTAALNALQPEERAGFEKIFLNSLGNPSNLRLSISISPRYNARL